MSDFVVFLFLFLFAVSTAEFVRAYCAKAPRPTTAADESATSVAQV